MSISRKIYRVERLGINGEGISHDNGLTVFIPFALPNEQVEARIIESKKNYSVANLEKILEPSSERIEPMCKKFPACGGCQLQHLDYDSQLKFKRQMIVDSVQRIGKISNVEILPTLGMNDPTRYRNKFQFPVGIKDRRLIIGCYARNSHDIIDNNECLIQKIENDLLANAIREAVEKYRVPIYDEDKHSGILRHVMGRVGINGELMAVFVTAKKDLPHAKEISKILRERVPKLRSIQQNFQPQHNNVILGRDTKILWGKDSITDKIGQFEFQISARSFFQVNTSQAEILYKKVLEFADLTGNEVVIDAYCGTGTISIFLARHARKVFGIEIVSSAIIDAKKNARTNKIHNVEFFTGDANFLSQKLFHEEIHPDVIVVDPPRAGCDESVLKVFARMKPEKIIYVSCNPATLARDLNLLDSLDYVTQKIQPVDMFPFTAHVESVSLITRRR